MVIFIVRAITVEHAEKAVQASEVTVGNDGMKVLGEALKGSSLRPMGSEPHWLRRH